jgi:hypothetical protein
MSQEAGAAARVVPNVGDPVVWGHGWHARFEGLPHSDVCLQRWYTCVKYACKVCGKQRKSIATDFFYQCAKCPYKICEPCALDRLEWRAHVCAPPPS